MRKLYICSAVIGAVVLGMATAALAEEYKKADAYWQPCNEGIVEYMYCD